MTDQKGLIHVSEPAAHRVADPAAAIQVGDLVRVKIVGATPSDVAFPGQLGRRMTRSRELRTYNRRTMRTQLEYLAGPV